MGKKNKVVSEAKSKVINFYGTKTEWVKGDLNIKLNEVISSATAEQAIVAEDSEGLYVTGKSFAGAPVLDPYRLYNRVVPTATTNEDGTVSYSIA